MSALKSSQAAAQLPWELRLVLRNIPRMALAFSGGVDSRFLAHAARLCGCEVMAVNAKGPHIPSADSDYAKFWAHKQEMSFIQIEFDPLNLPEVRHNSRERCYGCKKELLGLIKTFIPDLKAWKLCDGGNVDDQKEFRPGIKAVLEAGVISPLARAGLSKNDIRRIARATGMDNPDQPSRPCLLTRLNYGLTTDREDLERIFQCESETMGFLTACGLESAEFRLRLTPAPILQITRMDADIIPSLKEIMASYGFKSAQISLTDRISGFFDKTSPSGIE